MMMIGEGEGGRGKMRRPGVWSVGADVDRFGSMYGFKVHADE